MWITRVLALVICYCCVCDVNGKRFETRCKLVRELLKIGVPNDMFLGQWACLIEKTSNRNTSAMVTTPSGKKFYGLYQIPSVWCRQNKRGGECNMKCDDLLNEDIRDDTACAVLIHDREGFKYWSIWEKRCKNDNFITDEIYKCPDLLFSSPDRSSPINGRYQDQNLHSRFKHSAEADFDPTPIYRFLRMSRWKSSSD